MRMTIYTDGGSRGNPGPAACAFVVKQTDTVIDRGSSVLGVMTNNEAEYQGFLLSLDWLQKTLTTDVIVEAVTWRLDSKLVVEQLNKHWKIKEPRLLQLAQRCWERLSQLPHPYAIEHVPRAQNALADALLNQALDAQK